MKLGKKQVLTVVKRVDFGVYLGDDKERVLLPKKQIPEGVDIGDEVEVFLYKDSSDRLIATTREPKLMLGELAVLTVADTNKYGAFLEWGLEKDLFLPFKQQTVRVKKGDQCLVSLYIDKSERLCATTQIYRMLKTNPPYQRGDRVTGIIYDTSEGWGAFVAVDNQYSARIPKKECFGDLEIGTFVEARVMEVKSDGKMELSVRERIPEQMDKDAEKIREALQAKGGELPFSDKADPELIKSEFDMSKAAFKRAVGRLLKQGEIELDEESIRLKKEA